MDNIQAHQKDLCNKLWAMANALRGNMEAYEFKNYILGMIFYYYLSDRTEKYMAKLLKDDGVTYEDAWKNEELRNAVIDESLRDLGFVIEPQYLFRKMVAMVENRSFDIEFLQKAINSLMESTHGNESQDDFDGLFSDMQLDSTKLGHTVKDRSVVMAKIISALDEIGFSVEDTKIDILGNAYEYLIGQFAATAGKKAGEFYTPAGPAELLCRLACFGLTDVKAAADPTCGSGSLLLRLKKYVNVRTYYGQELTSTTYNLARMNMILRGIPYSHFEIYNGDTLEHDYFEERAQDKKYRIQVANPPYSANWSADDKFLEDERFSEYGKLAPKSKADFAFVQHMIHHMDEDGRIAVLLPHGVLFRGAAEETIRKYIIQKLNILDAVIGLPANLFFGTGIPVCVLVLKKNRNANSDNILFIDASKDFEPGKNQNILRDQDIDKIVETYAKREDVEKYAHVATMAEIEENGYNLNIPRYVDTFEKEEEIDLNAVSAEIKQLQADIKGINAELKPYFNELGLDFPFAEEN
ncbi:MAG: type I restriction-modification system subunit M [Alphaproteobacteria bacterium]|nr:type I restriction-modification system subunit M [Alphaproteobacteria bacterium]